MNFFTACSYYYLQESSKNKFVHKFEPISKVRYSLQDVIYLTQCFKKHHVLLIKLKLYMIYLL